MTLVWSPWNEERAAVEAAREDEVVRAPVDAAWELVPTDEPWQGTAAAAGGGHFAVEGVQEGHRLGARAPGWQPAGFGKRSGKQELRVAEDGSFERLLLMLGAPGVALSGRVLDAHGLGVAGARVLVAVDARKGEPLRLDPEVDREGLVLLADAEGRFTTDEVPAGRVLLVARPAEPSAPGVGWALADVRTDAANAFELTLRAGARVVGLVVDEQGRSVPDLDVVARWGGSKALGELEDELGPLLADVWRHTDDAGRYVLEGLLPGEHEVVVTAGGRVLDRRRLELAEGETVTFDVTVPLVTALAVRVLDEVGEPLVGWGVSFSTGDDGQDWSATRELDLPRRTDRAGRVAVDGLDPAPVQLAIYRPFPANEGGIRARRLDAEGTPGRASPRVHRGGLDLGKILAESTACRSRWRRKATLPSTRLDPASPASTRAAARAAWSIPPTRPSTPRPRSRPARIATDCGQRGTLEVTDPSSRTSLASGNAPHLMWALLGDAGQVLARIKTDPVFDPGTHRLIDRLRLAPGPARLSVLDDNRSPERAVLELTIEVPSGAGRAGGAPVRAAFPR